MVVSYASVVRVCFLTNRTRNNTLLEKRRKKKVFLNLVNSPSSAPRLCFGDWWEGSEGTLDL